MIPKDGLDIKYFLAVCRRRFWYVVIPFFLLSMVTVVYCIKTPRIFRSSSLILIQPQEVPDDYVRSTVTTDVSARLSSIKEEILSRSRLEEVIKKHGLYSEILATKTMYDAVEKMRKQIEINVKKTAQRRVETPSSFEIAYMGKDPAQVKNVTAALANLFIDHNYRLRSEQAAGTLKFLDRELERMRLELRKKEELVRQFKEKHVGLLPDQMESNYRILSQLQQQLDSLHTVLQQTEDRRILLNGQLGQFEALDSSPPEVGVGGRGLAGTQRPQSLEELRSQLKTLKSRYSDRHPDVIKLASTIAKMEEEQRAGIQNQESATSTSSYDSSNQTQRLIKVRRDGLLAELQIIDKEITSLRKEKNKITAQIGEYRQRIENGPKVEQMFVDLRRDYRQAADNYQSLLEKKMEAQLAENLERTQKGEQFKILDHANLPRKPDKPDIPKIIAVGFMLALACAFGLAYLREYLDPTFWSRKEVESMLDIPVLVAIPIIQTEKERRWKMIKRAAKVCILLVMSSGLGYAMYLLWKKNPTLLPL